MDEDSLVHPLSQLVSRHNAALLSALCCNPMVTQLAAQFVTDVRRREEFLRQVANSDMDCATPLLYLSAGLEDEKARLMVMVRLRLAYGDSIAVLFPMQRRYTVLQRASPRPASR